MRWLLGGTFLAAFAVRLWRVDGAEFGIDATTLLWMARDALAGGYLPDHGLVSSLRAFQPPGYVWMVLPAVWVGGGQPVVVMAWLALLDAAGITLLVWAVRRQAGLRLALLVAALLATSPFDAAMTADIWHPSLYVGAVSLLLAALLRLRSGGSRWWVVVPVALPCLYALIHYSGLALAPAVLLLPRRRWRAFLLPAALALVVVLLAWLPFLAFEHGRGWADLSGVGHAGGGGVAAVVGLVARPDILLLWTAPACLLIARVLARLPRWPVLPALAAAIVVVQLVTLNGLRDQVLRQPNAYALKERAAVSGESLPPDPALAWVPRWTPLYLPTDPPYREGADVLYLRSLGR